MARNDKENDDKDRQKNDDNDTDEYGNKRSWINDLFEDGS